MKNRTLRIVDNSSLMIATWRILSFYVRECSKEKKRKLCLVNLNNGHVRLKHDQSWAVVANRRRVLLGSEQATALTAAWNEPRVRLHRSLAGQHIMKHFNGDNEPGTVSAYGDFRK